MTLLHPLTGTRTVYWRLSSPLNNHQMLIENFPGHFYLCIYPLSFVVSLSLVCFYSVLPRRFTSCPNIYKLHDENVERTCRLLKVLFVYPSFFTYIMFYTRHSIRRDIHFHISENIWNLRLMSKHHVITFSICNLL